MCLGVPGQVKSITQDQELARLGYVSFGAVEQEINLTCVPGALPGDWVMVHAGIAIACVDEAAAQETLRLRAGSP